MPLKGKYLKYDKSITYEIFEKIWRKLIDNGWKEEDDNSIRKTYKDFTNRCNIMKDRYDKNFNVNTNTPYKLKETTVQEILGYDPFVKEEFALPEKWCVKDCAEVSSWASIIFNCENTYQGLEYLRVIQSKFPKFESYSFADEKLDYTEITFDQFKKYVLKDNIETPKEVTPEYVECIDSFSQFTKGKIYNWPEPKNDDNYTRTDINSIKIWENRFKPSTKEAFDAQNKPKQPLKQAVHCKTQEEWDFVTEKLGYKWAQHCSFSAFSESTCISLIDTQYSYVDYLKNDYQIMSFQEWCDLNGHKMGKEVKFEVGKWYKLYNWISKFNHLERDYKFYGENINTNSGFVDKSGWLDLNEYTPIELSIEEIQQYLPDGHPDKIKSDGFKVGDYVVITKSSKNWISEMNTEVGKIVQITHISDTSYINYEEKPCWSFGARDGHFRHATPEEINNHLISIGQIPAGEPLNNGIEPNKDGMFKYTTGNSYDKDFSTSIVPGPLKMTLSIDDEELPMVSIIKTNSIKQLLNLE